MKKFITSSQLKLDTHKLLLVKEKWSVHWHSDDGVRKTILVIIQNDSAKVTDIIYYTKADIHTSVIIIFAMFVYLTLTFRKIPIMHFSFQVQVS